MARPVKRAWDISLEEMASKHVVKTITSNDKSSYMLAKMNRRFGRKAATEAIEKAKETYAVMTGEKIRKEIPDNKPKVTVTGRMVSSLPRMQQLQGRAYNLSIIDDLVLQEDMKEFRYEDLFRDRIPES